MKDNENVSFDCIDPKVMQYSPLYKCGKSTAGQIILGLHHLAMHIDGKDDYDNNKKEISNDYQRVLYPKMAIIATKVVDTYIKYFVNDITDPIKKQVFGTNLNGKKNDGQLKSLIMYNGVDKNIRYKFAQFKQLLTLLLYRLNWISNKDSNNLLKKYEKNTDEINALNDLKLKTKAFSVFVKDEILVEWSKIVNETRKECGVISKTEKTK